MKLRLLFLLLFPFSVLGQTISGSGGSIPDNGPAVDFPIPIGFLTSTCSPSYGVTSVCIDVTHTYVGDLVIKLVAPDGTEVDLTTSIGGPGHNFTNTCFLQNAAASITSGSAPFTGSYKPMGNLGDVNNGLNANGNWKLRVQDVAAQDTGSVIGWNISFGSNAAGPMLFPGTRLPLVILNTNGQSIPNEPKISASMKIVYKGNNQVNQLTDSGNVYSGKIGIEIRGAYSASLPQKPYGLETRDTAGNPIDVSLLGMPAEHDWVLIANYNDKAFVRNTLAYKLFQEMGHYAARMQHCEVFLNGKYQGIYLLGEKIKRDNNRVDIAKLDTFENTYPEISGGYILKNDYYDNTNSWLSSFSPIDHPGFDVHFVYYYPTPQSITQAQKTYIQGFMNRFETALYSPQFKDSTLGYSKFISEKSFHDYFIVNELARNVDGFKKSRYFYKEKDSAGIEGKLKAGPVWDFDWAWKNILDCATFQATNGSGWSYLINDCNPDVNSNGWYVRLLQDTNYANRLHCRYVNLRRTILDTAYLMRYIDSMATYLDSAQMRHYAKWGHLGINSGAPEVGPIPTTFQGEVNALKNWIKLRVVWLDRNMPGTQSGCIMTATRDLRDLNNDVSIYPNPTRELMYIQTGLNVQSAVLLSMEGKPVRVVPTVEFQQGIELGRLSSGVYFLKLNCVEGTVLKKVVIQ